MSAKNCLDLKCLRKMKKKIFRKFQNILIPKNYCKPKKFFFFDFFTPKCIELNSEFVRPEKKLGFGFGSRPKTHRDPSQNVWLCVWWKWVGERMYEWGCVFVCVVVCRYQTQNPSFSLALTNSEFNSVHFGVEIKKESV